MEWVETTAKSVEEAKNQALDQLGVAEDDAEIVVLDEPRAGLFGRVRGEARVRARVRPTTPRPKLERRDRKKGKGDKVEAASSESTADGEQAPAAPRGRGGRAASEAAAGDATPKAPRTRKPKAAPATPAPAADAQRDAFDVFEDSAGTASGAADGTDESSGDDRPARAPRSGRQRKDGARAANAASANQDQSSRDQSSKEIIVDAEQVGEEARVFVQGVVDAFGLAGTAAVRRDGDDLEVTVDGSDLGLLVGPRGSTLQALQELARVAAQRRLGDHDTRLRVDVGGYRERRKEALTRFAHQVADQVIADGTAKRLEPMSSSDRKVIHDVLSEVDGVVTRSEGDDPRRCVVIAPAND
jgi:spoIIIJ-associated protein